MRGRPVRLQVVLGEEVHEAAVLVVAEAEGDGAAGELGEVLRIVAKFDLPAGPLITPKRKSDPEYVYHCHILEHEENDMMRPIRVLGGKTLASK